MLNVRATSTSKPDSVFGAGTLGSVLRTGSTVATATAGVKGITKEELERAEPTEPNIAEVSQLERYAVSANDARSSARTGKLSARSAPLLEDKK